MQRGFYDRKLTWQPLWNEVIAGSGVGFAVIISDLQNPHYTLMK
jgi:hypothetical protein